MILWSWWCFILSMSIRMFAALLFILQAHAAWCCCILSEFVARISPYVIDSPVMCWYAVVSPAVSLLWLVCVLYLTLYVHHVHAYIIHCYVFHWLCLSGAYEGLAAASVVLLHPRGVKLQPMQRISSFSLKRGLSAMKEVKARPGGKISTQSNVVYCVGGWLYRVCDG